MSTINDLKYRELHQHGFSGTLDDMLASFYKEAGTNGEHEWLSNILGKNGSLNNLRYEYLLSQGFTGSHNDMLFSSLMNSRYLNYFTPSSLFAASEPGVWLDPSDFSTMFQDAAGTTPVTAVEQPVGLILDKSKGLVLGPELVTNGDFSNGTTGWTAGNSATFSVAAGVATITNSISSVGRIAQSFSTIVGNTYKVTATFSNPLGGSTGGQLYIGTSTGTFNVAFTTAATGSVTLYFRATTTTTHLAAVTGVATTGASIQADNISVRELPGNHATQTTSTSRPVLKQDGSGKYYLLFDGVDDWLITPTITPGVDKAQVFAGVRKLSDAAAYMRIVEYGDVVAANGSLSVSAPTAIGAATYEVALRGTQTTAFNLSTFAAPITSVLSSTFDIGQTTRETEILPRVNASTPTLVGTGSANAGTDNFGNHAFYIGRRGGTTLPFNGHLYGLVVRFGANLPAGTIASTETWLNGKTGAY